MNYATAPCSVSLWVAAFVLGGCTNDVPFDGFTNSGGTATTQGSGGPTTSASSTADGSADGSMDDGVKLDVSLDAGGLGCKDGGGPGGDIEFSNIWIANSPDSTISKIDTSAGQELENIRFLLVA